MIYFECPSCNESIQAPADMAGLAWKCQQCGEVALVPMEGEAGVEEIEGDRPEETELYHGRPAMFRNAPLKFIGCIILIAVFGLGLILLLVWWLKCVATTLIITTRRVVVEEGIVSKYTNEVRLVDIRNVKVSQNVMQRLFNVGRLDVSTAGTSGVEISVRGIANPQHVADIIRAQQK